jgi:hypothetical protein
VRPDLLHRQNTAKGGSLCSSDLPSKLQIATLQSPEAILNPSIYKVLQPYEETDGVRTPSVKMRPRGTLETFPQTDELHSFMCRDFGIGVIPGCLKVGLRLQRATVAISS